MQDVRNGAAQMGKRLGDALNSGAMQQVADDTLMMREEGGLWVFAKRLSRGAEPAKPPTGKRSAYQFGPMKVRAGDEWLIGKTDKPGRLAPDAHKLQQVTIEQWAKLKDPFRNVASLNPMQQEMNLMMRALSSQDWAAMRTLSRQNWISRTGSKLAEQVKKETGLANQASIQQYTEKLYDIFAPKAAKVQKDPVFGRYYGLLEGVMRYADDTMKRVMYGR